MIDTETTHRQVDDDEVHSMRLWAAQTRRRGDKHPSRPRREKARGHTASELADWLETQAKSTPPVWVYCHNLSFDLATTRIVLHLVERGWTLGSHNLASDAPWALLRRGSRTIRLADSWSVLPEPLEAIGEKIGVRKPPLPQQDDSDDAWFARCEADVEITITALVQVMDWWDEHRLGHWSVTGPRTGYNAMRHRCVRRDGYDPGFLQQGPGKPWVQLGDGHVVIDPDPEARAFERDTLYQGRREAWKVGILPRGMYAELDMQRAHLTVARLLPLPCRRGNAFDWLPVDSQFIGHESVSMIADCVVKTDTPRYPVRTRAGIIHPVGRFATRLAGPEIAEARDRGELVEVGKGYFYRLSYHMQPWALWAESVLADDGGVHPPAARIAVKGWSRSVPGTWAARTSRVVMEGSSPVQGWYAEPGIDAETRQASMIVHMAGRMQMMLRDVESDDSFPAVLSFIQSHVRVALSRAIDRIPDHRMVTCSTDSLLVDTSGWSPQDSYGRRRGELGDAATADGRALALWLAGDVAPFTLTVKQTAADVRVLSPQHVRMDGKRRYSGVSKGAEEPERDQFRFLTWPKLGTQMRTGAGEGYVRQLRTLNLSAMTVPRFMYECGCTAAPVMRTLEQVNEITGAEYPECPRHPGHVLAVKQHPALKGA